MCFLLCWPYEAVWISSFLIMWFGTFVFWVQVAVQARGSSFSSSCVQGDKRISAPAVSGEMGQFQHELCGIPPPRGWLPRGGTTVQIGLCCMPIAFVGSFIIGVTAFFFFSLLFH